MSPKKIAIFFDGTWNRADQKCPTNIAKLFEATAQFDSQNQIHQLAHYIQGVGNRINERLTGGGFGYGISDNIKDGYKFLIGNYMPGDEIYVFGFSRGAFSARSLAGLIRNLGILKREKLFLINEAYKRYRDKAKTWEPDGESSIKFKEENTWGNESVKFLGVFDTVGALGAPFGIVSGWIINKIFKCSFHDTKLSKIVENAYHAIAIDEHRLPFQPTLMTPNARHNSSNFEQKWFPGVHSDIGGGYENAGLSDLALEWMASKATSHGLNIDLTGITRPVISPDVKAPVNRSQTVLYCLATVLFVKLPGFIGMVPGKYKAALPNIEWNGDYIRPIEKTGDVSMFIGNPPQNSNLSQYRGDLHFHAIDKVNKCRNEYRPANVLVRSHFKIRL